MSDPPVNVCSIKMAARRTKQLGMKFRTWGGKRKGAGRKRRLSGPRRVAHRRRPRLASRFPVHVTSRVVPGGPRLRSRKACRIIRNAMFAVSDQAGFRICQFSILGNHLHLVCEAKSNAALAAGLKRFKWRVARGINLLVGRRGSLFLDRYHMEILRTPAQVHAALCYVLHNARRHGMSLPRDTGGIDPFSSAWWFDGWSHEGWRRGLAPPPDGRACVSRAHTWLLSTGWRRRGLLDPLEMPAAGRR